MDPRTHRAVTPSTDSSRRRRPLVVTARVPPPGPDEPTDDELLLYLDGALEGAAQAALEARLARSPLSQARLAVLRDALDETDDTDA